MKLPSFFMCSVFVALSFLNAKAQSTFTLPGTDKTGLPQGGSFEGTTENINLQNGNVHIELPLLHLPGVAGLDLNLNLLIDSKAFKLGGGHPPKYEHYSDTYSYYPPGFSVPDLPTPPFAGGHLSLPALSSDFITFETYGTADGGGISFQYPPLTCNGAFTFYDRTGTTHSFNNLTNCQGGPQPSVVNINIDDTYDGSLFRLDTTDVHDIVVYDKSGIQYHFDVASSLPTRISDLNGNSILFSRTGTYPNYTTTITDSQNRSIVITQSTIAYKDSKGQQQAINSATYTDATNPISFLFNSEQSVDGSYFFGNETPRLYNYPDTHSTLSLPTGETYTLYYDALSELTKIVYPTGGYTRYVYQVLPSGGYFDSNWTVYADMREIQQRSTCSNTSGTCSSSEEQTTTYTTDTVPDKAGNGWMDVRDPEGNRTRVVFSTVTSINSLSGGARETDRYIYTGENTLLRTIHTDYTTDSSVGGITGCSLPNKITTTLNDVSPAIQNHVELDYDTIQLTSPRYVSLLCGTTGSNSNNVIAKREYGFDGTLMRTTTQSWLSNSPNNPHLLDRMTSSSISSTNPNFEADRGWNFDGSGNLISETLGGTNSNTNTTQFGRDTHGRLTSITDAKQFITTFDYVPAWVNNANNSCAPVLSASPTSTINPDAQKTSTRYNACTGTIYDITDVNKQVTSFDYDAIGRVTDTAYYGGRGSHVDYSNGQQPPTVITTTVYASPSPNEISKTELDGLGRTASSTAPSGAKVDTTYNGFGSVQSVSNPYITTSDLSYGITSFLYDGLGRKVDQCQPTNTNTNSTICMPSNSYQSWSNMGNVVIFKDEDGNKWQRTSDALGRLTQILEPDGMSQSPSMETDYVYDVLNNLTSITQYGAPGSTARIRLFSYDGLSRLLTSNNPETGILCYGMWDGGAVGSGNCVNGYDPNNNLVMKTDARGAVSNYVYDSLNHLIEKNYSSISQSGVDPTPTVNYTYGTTNLPGGSNSLGRLIDETVKDGSTLLYERSIPSYNEVGDVLIDQRCVPNSCSSLLNINYTYDLASHVSNAEVNYLVANGGTFNLQSSYDQAGRIRSETGVASNGSQALTINLMSNAEYSPFGAISKLNGIETRKYDSRGRIKSLAYDLSGTGYPSYNAIYDSYSLGGNLTELHDSVNGHWNYTYDSLSRLKTATSETLGPSTYTYDSFGNRIEQTGIISNAESFGNGNNRADCILHVANSTGCYDASGNQIRDINIYTTNAYSYDAEGRLSGITTASNHYTYLYDGENQRIGEYIGDYRTGSLFKGYLREANGQFYSVIDSSGLGPIEFFGDGRHIASIRDDVYVPLIDALGTERIRLGAINGSVQYITSLPFGDNLDAGSFDPSPLHFTGKERDTESGLDYFGARYYGSSMGRFMSPDPSGLTYADLGNPQSFNLYSYVRNNPLTNIDPSGLDCVHVNNDTGAYEGFESGDCDNSTEEKANSGQYVDGTVNQISFNGQGQVTGYDANTSSGMFDSYAGSLNPGATAANLNPYTNALSASGQSVNVSANSPQSPSAIGSTLTTLIHGPLQAPNPYITHYVSAYNPARQSMTGDPACYFAPDAVSAIHSLRQGNVEGPPSPSTDGEGAVSINQNTTAGARSYGSQGGYAGAAAGFMILDSAISVANCLQGR